VLDYVRWVMVRKNNLDAAAPETVIPDLAKVIAPDDLAIP
jgi:2-methylfumaryl-CoA hydratase